LADAKNLAHPKY
jgi:hypothetical protein